MDAGTPGLARSRSPDSAIAVARAMSAALYRWSVSQDPDRLRVTVTISLACPIWVADQFTAVPRPSWLPRLRVDGFQQPEHTLDVPCPVPACRCQFCRELSHLPRQSSRPGTRHVCLRHGTLAAPLHVQRATHADAGDRVKLARGRGDDRRGLMRAGAVADHVQELLAGVDPVGGDRC